MKIQGFIYRFSRHMKTTRVVYQDFLSLSQLVCITASSDGGLVGIGCCSFPGDGTGTSSTCDSSCSGALCDLTVHSVLTFMCFPDEFSLPKDHCLDPAPPEMPV